MRREALGEAHRVLRAAAAFCCPQVLSRCPGPELELVLAARGGDGAGVHCARPAAFSELEGSPFALRSPSRNAAVWGDPAPYIFDVLASLAHGST